tara:strand:+ start:1724 stop:2326 length:603 start_codon:yes stop_codon:yes gene_type:complete
MVSKNQWIQLMHLRRYVMAETPLKVMGLSGSLGRASKNGMLVDLALSKAESKGAEVFFWDLQEKPLPLVGEEGCWSNPMVKEFQELAASCDAFLVSSPEYHGTMSGVMKNTFDWVYENHVGGKVFGLMSTLGGMSNSNTLNHMRIMLRWLHANPVSQQLALGHVKEAFAEDGSLVDETMDQRLENLVDSVLKTAEMYRNS